MSFEANRGQTDAAVRFLARGPGYALFITDREAVLSVRKGGSRNDTNRADVSRSHAEDAVVRIRLAGSAAPSSVTGLDRLPWRSNYFIGNDATKWRSDVPNYARVKAAGVYPGIDLVYYGNPRQLEYDFIVAPGADPSRIELTFDGLRKLSIDGEGNLVLDTGSGAIVQRRPVIYQEAGGTRQRLEASFVLRGTNGAAFRIGWYDPSRPLVIDPTLTYATYLGGSGDDFANAIVVDGSGNAYVTGPTRSTNFPVTAGAAQPANAGGFQDVFVSKLNAAGTALFYSTYLGGGNTDIGRAITVDASGNAYVTGNTVSVNFPTTAGALQTAYGGGFSEGFVTKLNPSGNVMVYSTYLGGTGDDFGQGIAVDSSGNAYVAGSTSSIDFPTASPIQAANGGGAGDAFVTKINAAGSALIYSTYLGGNGNDGCNAIALDGSGNAYVTGVTTSTNLPTVGAFQAANGGLNDAFVAKINAAGSALAYSSYLGGSNRDTATGVAVDSAGNAYVTGQTDSLNFPTVNAFQSSNAGPHDVFITKVNAAGSAIVYSTYLGGAGGDAGQAIAVDSSGSAYVTGSTYSGDFPTLNPIETFPSGTFEKIFVTKFSPSGSTLAWSTYLGGNADEGGDGIGLDSSGNVYITGETDSTNLATAGAFQTAFAGVNDAFVVKITAAATTTTAVTSSLNPSTVGQSVTFTATVTGSSPTGTIQFMDGATTLGAPVTMSGGSATFTTSTLTTGSHPITAVYSGDANNTASTSPVLTQTVNAAAATTTVVTSSLNPSNVGQAVTFTATVSGSSPTGTVQFRDGTTALGSPVTLSGGGATFTTSTLTAGSHSITAVYSGDTANAASTSAVLTQVVNAAPPAATGAPTLSIWALLLLGLAIAVFAMKQLA